MIVNRRHELIGPVVEAIAHQQIAALQAGILLLGPEQFIEKTLGARIDAHAPSDAVGEGNIFVAARPGIPQLPRSLLSDP